MLIKFIFAYYYVKLCMLLLFRSKLSIALSEIHFRVWLHSCLSSSSRLHFTAVAFSAAGNQQVIELALGLKRNNNLETAAAAADQSRQRDFPQNVQFKKRGSGPRQQQKARMKEIRQTFIMTNDQCTNVLKSFIKVYSKILQFQFQFVKLDWQIDFANLTLAYARVSGWHTLFFFFFSRFLAGKREKEEIRFK